MLLSETNYNHIKETKYEVAVLPWGATEAHNFHLPYCTDNYQSEYIAKTSAEIANSSGAKVIVLPTVPFGVNTTQMDIPYTINLMPSTQAYILKDIIQSLFTQQLNKLVILNGHGGNDFKQVIRELYTLFPEFFVCSIDWFKILNNNLYFNEPGDHAGEMETSNMMFIKNELVLPLNFAGTGKSRNFKLNGLQNKTAWTPRNWKKVTDDTGIGNPSKAETKKGEIFLNDLTNKIAAFLIELSEVSINDLYE